MRKAVTPWLRTRLSVSLTDTFDPGFLDDPQATLFGLAPTDGTVARAAVKPLDSLVRRWRNTTAARALMASMQRLLIVDKRPTPPRSRACGASSGDRG